MAYVPETVRYLAETSKNMLERQISSYREKRSVAATIIGLNALLVPFFLSGLFEAEKWIKISAMIPLGLISAALFFLLKIYYAHTFEQGLALSMYSEIITKSEEEALIKEIGVNRDSYTTNSEILDQVNKDYKRGIILTSIALVTSIAVLGLNMYFRPNPSPQEVKIVSQQTHDNIWRQQSYDQSNTYNPANYYAEYSDTGSRPNSAN